MTLKVDATREWTDTRHGDCGTAAGTAGKAQRGSVAGLRAAGHRPSDGLPWARRPGGGRDAPGEDPVAGAAGHAFGANEAPAGDGNEPGRHIDRGRGAATARPIKNQLGCPGDPIDERYRGAKRRVARQKEGTPTGLLFKCPPPDDRQGDHLDWDVDRVARPSPRDLCAGDRQGGRRCYPRPPPSFRLSFPQRRRHPPHQTHRPGRLYHGNRLTGPSDHRREWFLQLQTDGAVMKKKCIALISLDAIQDKIHFLRGCKVMLDSDLAGIYQVETFNLNKAVRRNMKRFPDDFMFRLTRSEYHALRFQFGILKRGSHSKYLPHAFTQE